MPTDHTTWPGIRPETLGTGHERLEQLPNRILRARHVPDQERPDDDDPALLLPRRVVQRHSPYRPSAPGGRPGTASRRRGPRAPRGSPGGPEPHGPKLTRAAYQASGQPGALTAHAGPKPNRAAGAVDWLLK